jgi:hypothetical protein
MLELNLDNIRGGAMNPPAQQADEEERRWREEMDALWERARRRSGTYRLASMLVPQDFGDILLTLAMSPGARLGMRTALAALGGLTTQIGDAEGAFLPKEMFRRLRAHPSAAARREAARGEDAITNAERHSGVGVNDFVSWSPQVFNNEFPELLQLGAPYGAIPTEAGWVALLSPQRPLRLLPQLSADAEELLRRPELYSIARPQSEYRFDPWLDFAIGLDTSPNVHIRRSTSRGYYDPIDNSITLSANHISDAPSTFEHELQHRVQHLTPGRYLVGSSTQTVVPRNSLNLWYEYLRRTLVPDKEPAVGWMTAPGGIDPRREIALAQYNMYLSNFGEWEARLAARAHEAAMNPARLGGQEGESWLDTYRRLIDSMADEVMPDFRVQ